MTKSSARSHWLESTGGPLVAIPAAVARMWRGVQGSSYGGDLDYDRACAIRDELGMIPCDSIAVLVLGDEPLRTTWMQHGDTGMLIRWVYGDSEESVEAAATWERAQAVAKDVGIRIHAHGAWLLIDSADPGDEPTSGSLKLDLAPGAYAVESGILDAGREVRLLVHCFIPVLRTVS